jgi:hypothetical protein
MRFTLILVTLGLMAFLAATVGVAITLTGDRPVVRSDEQVRLDLLYEVLVGEDSASILSTMKRVEAKVQEICDTHYEGRC